MISCREVVEFLWRYHSGELPEGEQLRFEAHLAHCSGCHAYLRGYTETIRLTRVALLDPAAAVPVEVPEELLRAILQARAAESRRPGGSVR